MPNMQPPKPRYKNWLVNLLLLIAVAALMLILSEGFLRWLDGFQLSNLKLEQVQPSD